MRDSVSLALGMFDGVHIGHKALINKALEFSPDAIPVVFTFSNHPASIFKRPVKLLSLPFEKELLLKACGAQRVEMIAFDEHFAALSPEEYIKFLISQFNIKNIIVGYNHVFGKAAAGNGAALIRYGKVYGYKTFIVPPVLLGDTPVSSTQIRQSLTQGEIEKANAMLGYNYFLTGTVVGGKQIGAELGFPTANISVDFQKQLPKDGVYITLTKLNGTLHRSITNIGNNPTVSQEGKTSIETHILRFNDDIYDEVLRIYFVKKLRDEIAFSSRDALSHQLSFDKQNADAFLNNYLSLAKIF